MELADQPPDSAESRYAGVGGQPAHLPRGPHAAAKSGISKCHGEMSMVEGLPWRLRL